MAAPVKTPAKARSKTKKLSPEERSRRAAQRAFARQVRTIFLRSGFKRAVDAADKEFKFGDRTSDFDDVFVRENVIVCAEYTLSQASQLGSHVKNKAHVYNAINEDESGFIEFLRSKFPDIEALIPKTYHTSQLRLRTLYCSQTELKAEYASLGSGPINRIPMAALM